MNKINKELYTIYLRIQLYDITNSNEWNSIWYKLYQLTGRPMDFYCPEYKKALKEVERIKNSPLYKALEEE